MRARPILLTMLLAAAMPADVSPAAEKPRNYRTELREAQSQQRRKRYDESIAVCDKMLAHFKEAWQVKEVSWVKIEDLILDDQYEAALKALAGLAGAFAQDKALQAAGALRTGDVQRMLKRFDEAVATYRKLAADCASKQPDPAADALLRAAKVVESDLKKPREAIALYQEAESKFGARNPKQGAEALRQIATVHEGQTKDLAKAAEAYRALTAKYAAIYDERTLSVLYDRAIACFLKARKLPEAAAVAKKAEASLTEDAQRASFAVRQGDALMEMEKIPEARAQFERVLTAYPLDQKSCQQALTGIVETYRAKSQWVEALGAARVLYDAAGSEKDIRDAAQVVARAFLAVDATVRRANEFLSYQRYGPDGPDAKGGTDDDVSVNHLAKVKYPARPAAVNKQFQAAIKAQPDTYDGYRAKGFLYVYWGKPKEGAGQFLRAFKAASLPQLPAASQELVLVGMKAQTASFRALDRVFEYINYGPKGKTGKKSLADPFAGLP